MVFQAYRHTDVGEEQIANSRTFFFLKLKSLDNHFSESLSIRHDFHFQ